MTTKRKSPFIYILCIILGGIVLFTTIFKKNENKDVIPDSIITSTPQGTSRNSVTTDLLELPKLMDVRSEQIITHKAYTVSYNSDWRIPNWVAYELTRAEASGTGERADFFEPDPEVYGASASYKDYSTSEYDRGHMAPAGDMKWDQTAMDECFYLSNICPQNHNLNSGDWNDLEMQIRYLAKKHGNVYIACGPIVSAHPETIGYNHVAVPAAFYKVCLCKIDGTWQGIGFIFENKGGHKRLSAYCKSIDEVEKITGIDFFPNLDDEVENNVESQYNVKAWRL